jgi:uncharacterized protein YxjI
MGVFSKYLRYREAGEDTNVVNAERFGEPAHSLFISTKFFSLHQATDITDEKEQVVYRASSKVFSLHDKTDITDAAGNQVAHIERKFFTLHERHFVTMADGFQFQISNELWHIYKDVTNIEGLGWQLRGNLFELNFELYDQAGGVIAVISQKLVSIHDKYAIDIYQPDKEPIVVAILITLQHVIRDRERRRSASSSSFSSSSASASSN